MSRWAIAMVVAGATSDRDVEMEIEITFVDAEDERDAELQAWKHMRKLWPDESIMPEGRIRVKEINESTK